MNAAADFTRGLTGYRLFEQLHNSSRTIVYRAIREIDKLPVVVKMLKREYPSSHELLQFRNQYAITKNLNLPSIIKTYDLEHCGNSYALIIEDFGGISLKEYTLNRILRVDEFLAIALQLAESLNGLYCRRIVHKDIKPANILINPETKQVKLIDFSIASRLPKETQEIRNPNILEGTLAYISPEQTGRMNRGIDYRSDFYSLGITFYELLTGKLPFNSDEAIELVHCHLARTALPLGERVKGKGEGKDRNSPSVLSDMVMKLMAKNAEDRYQSALGLKYDLEKCLFQWQATGNIEQFDLGKRDICDRFLIPEKLYGREKEVKTLLAAFERVAVGNREMMLVAGFSGIGKTAVINEVHKPIVRQRGYFIKGKFDQFNRNIPFNAFLQAFRDLMGQLLGENDVELAKWKTKILKALGENAQVIIEVIPELEGIIGQQPTVPELSGSAAKNRFNRLFQKFIQVFATQSHPLVMFIDDLQWVDSASLKLMQLLMGDSETSHLLFLGAYRDNEVFPTHPLTLTLDEIVKLGATLNTITLDPLSVVDLNQLVADTLSCDNQLALPLTELVHGKTKGNPFFATQFIKGLHEDGLITFNLGLGYWQCNMTQVQELALTDDVVEFMATRLHRLPERTQEMLKFAACISNQFELSTLAIVCEKPLIEVATALWCGLQEGLILPISNTYKFFQGNDAQGQEHSNNISVGYKFLHDRVQQAAYSLISEKQKPITHYLIGKRLLSNLSPTEKDERIFDIVNQINIGQTLVEDRKEKKQLIELNLKAGQKAQAATAYEAAKTYFHVGIDLLTEKAWTTSYKLIFKLHFLLAEVQLMSVDFQSLEKTIATLLKFANSPLDKAQIYVLKVNQYSLQGPYTEAIKAGLKGLRELGIVVDRGTLKELIQEDSLIIEETLKNRSIQSLLDLPIATNPEAKVAIELLMNLLSAAYITSDIELYGFTVVRNLRLSIEHGNIPKSITGYVNYGEWLGLMENQYQRGVKFADLALQLSYKLNSKSQQSSACFLFGGCIYVKAKPIRGAAELNYEGFLAGMDSGELQYAGYNLFANIYNRLFAGQNLATISTDLDKYWSIAKKIQNDLALSVLAACRFFIKKLFHNSNEQDNSSLAEREQAWIERHKASQSYLPLGIYYILHMHEACLNESINQGVEYGTEASKFLTACSSCTTAVGYYYYGSLNLLGAYSDLDKEERRDVLQQIEGKQKHLQILSESCPENFLHKYLLVEAERSRVIGKHLEAIDIYDQAIAQAQENEFIQEEALANELAAKFYLDWGKEKVAAGYMQEAYYCYAKWGATAKTEQLEAHYPRLLSPILHQVQPISSWEETIIESQGSYDQNSSSSISFALDFAAILKASQSLSKEIELDKLLATLLKLIIENAGANKCIFMLNEANELRVEAVMELGKPPNVLTSVPLKASKHIPLHLINTVKRTLQPAVISDATIDNSLLNDSYIQQYQPKSLLCTPILYQSKLLGLVYLENNLVAGAFTASRIEVVNILCTQAAISIENAQLYSQLETYSHTLEEKVEARTKQLQTAQQQIIAQEKLASLGALTAGVAHELRNPLNFVNNYAEGSAELTIDLLEVVEEQSEAINPESLEYIKEIIGDFKDNAAAIQKHGQRAANIIRNMMQHARSDDSSCQKIELNKLLDEARQLAYHSRRSIDNSFNITFSTQYDESIGEVEVFSSSLNRAFINLIDNGCYAAWSRYKEKGSPFVPTLKITTKNLTKKVEIRIRDNGTGIPSEVVKRIFDPFFTTKPTGEGTGLGLSLTHEIIVGQHKGNLRVETEQGIFTEFILALPLRNN